jgi:hypothetical protein
MTKSDITFQDKLNELRLDLTHPNSAGVSFVLVEGSSDIKLFRKFFDLQKCKVEQVPGGNQKLEECVNSLVQISSLIVGVRDSDFIKLSGNNGYPKPNIVLTDFHDIETTAINKDSILNAIIFELSDIDQSLHKNVRDDIMNSIKSIGLLKWLNEIESLELRFDCGFQDILDFSNLTIDFDQYITRVVSKSPNAKITDLNILKTKSLELDKTNPEPFHLINGHDVLNAFAKFFREEHGNKGLSGKDLEMSVRMLFSIELFETTTLHSELSSWETTNNVEILKKASA